MLKKHSYSSILKTLGVALFATSVLFTNLYAQKMSDEEYDKFILGRSFFTIPWVEAPSATTARDGLGPLFSANTCTSCHPKHKKGNYLSKTGKLSRSVVAKLSLTSSLKESINYEPTYGSQISINGIHGVKYEAKIKHTTSQNKDGLIETNYYLTDLQYGNLHKDAKVSIRVAPTLNGIGLIGNISEEEILKNQDIEDINKDGISGRANYVYSKNLEKVALGKYGYKAQIATLKEQVADAAHHDMGLTTYLYPNENCTKSQKECLNADKPRDDIDIPNHRLEAMTFFIENIKVTQNKNFENIGGYGIFKAISCNKCHIETLTNKDGKKLALFSDLLLHDMGKDLADERVESKASKSEFRTTPLWGLSDYKKGDNVRYLHDGRAKTLNEAILWHGGEANDIKIAYKNLDKKNKEKLINFLREL